MRIIFACGGTGGHITPALAIADTVRANLPRAAILFVGTEQGMENTLVPTAGYELRGLPAMGLSRSLSPKNLKALHATWRSIALAGDILSEFRPDIVIGTGGYACYPILRAAVRRGIPAAVHESNAVPGLAVRMLAGQVNKVWLNFAEAGEKFPRKVCVHVVGNPLPRGFGAHVSPTPLPAGCRCMVLSFGGSLGARELNRSVLELMAAEDALGDVYHLHATGKREFEEWQTVFLSKGLDRSGRMKLVPFLSDMPRHMAAASLVISRSGALTVSELAAAKRAAVLVPSPNVTGNHQYKNAAAVAGRGGAVLLSETELSSLTQTVLSLLGDAEKRAEMERAIATFAHPEANRLILEDIFEMTGKR